MRNLFKFFLISITAFSLVSCSYRPILDHNAKYLEVGEDKAEKDIDECKKAANEALDKYKAERAAKEAGRKSIIGAVFGTIFGFLGGGGVKSVLTATGVGAGIGAGVGALSVAGEDKVTPDQMKQRYEANCLARKGYSVIGWR